MVRHDGGSVYVFVVYVGPIPIAACASAGQVIWFVILDLRFYSQPILLQKESKAYVCSRLAAAVV